LHALANASGFPNCFPAAPLSRFWASPTYVASNPNIITIWSIHSYAFEFDNATSSLALDDISVENGSTLLARSPPSLRQQLSEPASLLSQANAELAQAQLARDSSHELSEKAQLAVRDNFGIQYVPVANVFLLESLARLNTLLKVLDISSFVCLYPAQYSASLEHAASAHDLAQSAARSLSQCAQSEYEYLSNAGAGSPGYSGKASSPFAYAESLLAPGAGFCSGEIAAYQPVYDYFSSSPQMPDFSQPSFASRVNSIAGTGANSSVSRMLSLCLLLSDAKEGMLADYETAEASAQESARQLSLEASLLGNERLELIGDPPPPSGGAGLLVGSGYAGIHSGYLQAKEDLARAQSGLSGAKALFASKGANGWLAAAMAEAQSSDEISQNALASLRTVRANAEEAVLAQREAAEDVLEQARIAVSSPASQQSAQPLSSARETLLLAEKKLSSAPSLPSLGSRYSAYVEACQLASQAISLSQSSASASSLQDARRAYLEYHSLVLAAEDDGLDVSYERELLSQYNLLLSASQSPDVVLAVSDSVRQEMRALGLRLYESFSYLEAKYSEAAWLAGELGDSRSLGKLPQYFPSGRLDASKAAGHMHQCEGELDSLVTSLTAKVPTYLSSALSQGAHAAEAYETPVLGRQTPYSAQITTANPSGLSHSGPVSFSLSTSVPLYSSDLAGGDSLSDAYPDKGKSAIIVPSVSAGQRFSFQFSKKDQPAQITSSVEECELASEESADVAASISFVSSRALDALGIAYNVPSLSHKAAASYGGQSFPLSSSSSGLLSGEISGVPQGKGSLSITYSVLSPFALSLSERSYETLPLGSKKVSFTAATTPSVGCKAGEISIFEPYTGITNLSITPLSTGKVSHAAATPVGAETQISFSFSPLAKSKEQQFAISYVVQDPQQALSEALSQAEILVLTYNRTKDALALSEARALASQGRANDALAALSGLRRDAQTLSYSTGDYQLYLEEKASANARLEELLLFQQALANSNQARLPQFSSALFKYQSSVSQASGEADNGAYSKAVTLIRKANSDLSSSLAALSLSSLNAASDEYAKARKAGAGDSGQATLLLAKDALSGAQSSYSQGEFTKSLLSSSEASALIAAATGSSEEDAEKALSTAEALRSSYSSLRMQAESLLSNYSSQYSALSTQSRRQLPFTPAQAQSRLDEADKLLAASKKTSLSPQEALLQANSSHEKLSSFHASLSAALSSLEESAQSSLDVARAALLEAKSRASEEDAKQIGEEVSRAESFLANAMYADSLAASDRAIKAANAALSGSSGTNPLQPVLLAAVSVAFIAGAAYYFFSGRRKAPPSGKKEVPKAEAE
jgi:hypothetical protein